MNKGPLLRCEKCGEKVVVADTRTLPEQNGEVYRRRIYKCVGCGRRFETLEKIKWKGMRVWQGPI